MNKDYYFGALMQNWRAYLSVLYVILVYQCFSDFNQGNLLKIN